MGQLSNRHPNGHGFRPDDVHRMMRQFWIEYVVANPQLFKTTERVCADLGVAGLIGRQTAKRVRQTGPRRPVRFVFPEPTARNGKLEAGRGSARLRA